jgi:hypothetical protein
MDRRLSGSIARRLIVPSRSRCMPICSKTLADGPANAERAGCIGRVVKRSSAGNRSRLNVAMPRTNWRSHQYAQVFRNEVAHLVVVDAPLPGTRQYSIVIGQIHARGISHSIMRETFAEMLVAGRERQSQCSCDDPPPCVMRKERRVDRASAEAQSPLVPGGGSRC